MRISVFGLGYVGAVSCGCLAEIGHHLIGTDVAAAKVDAIAAGRAPVAEVGLDAMLARALAEGRLAATLDAASAVADSDCAMLCVGTPSLPSGGVNASHLRQAMTQIARALRDRPRENHFSVLCRSTCLPSVHAELIEILARESDRAIGEGIGYACHPEFLREGAAVRDFFEPPKIVFGATDDATRAQCDRLYPKIDAPVFHVEPAVAAMVKYADNCFHAVKVTFGNEVGLMCREFGIDAHEVMGIFCADTKLNISPRYLKPGVAFGGSCLPKDLRGLLDASRERAVPLPMLAATLESNRQQIERLLARVISPARPRVGLVGLAFKEGTDDVRESPMVVAVERLAGKGHGVRIYDEHLSLGSLVGANRSFALNSIPHLEDLLVDDLQQVVDACDVLLVHHRLTPERWASVTWRPGQRVLDLVNVPALKDVAGYEGLYW